jgi:hypothetical protein
MLDLFAQLGFFTAKAIIMVIMILGLLAGILALLGKGKGKPNGRIQIKNLNKVYQETTETLFSEILSKDKVKKPKKKIKPNLIPNI